MLKAVLFDLDDTLIDWSGFGLGWDEREHQLMGGVYDYVNREVHALEDFDTLIQVFRELTRDAWEAGRSSLRAPHVGRVLVETLTALGVPPERIDERRCMEAYGWEAAPGVVTFPEVPAVLELLIQNGVRIGIVTNAHQPMWMRDRELAQLGLLDYFPECRISAADAGYLKPHPNIFEMALGCLDTLAEEAVFVGDNPVADIAGAQGAGIQAVLRVRQPMSPMLSGLIVPDRAIDSLQELPDVLDEWFPGWR
jgi:FMN phosphatase YigB (HAD superfamily)